MKSLLSVITMCLFVTSSYAANIHTSRANIKQSQSAQKTSDELSEVSKELEYSGDESNPKLLKRIADIEKEAASLKEQVLMKTFAQFMFEEIERLGCKSLDDEKCLSKAFMNGYDKSHRLTR